MKNKGDYPNAAEDRIGDETSENIFFSVNFSTIDFIEQGHENKRIEDHRKMF